MVSTMVEAWAVTTLVVARDTPVGTFAVMKDAGLSVSEKFRLPDHFRPFPYKTTQSTS